MTPPLAGHPDSSVRRRHPDRHWARLATLAVAALAAACSHPRLAPTPAPAPAPGVAELSIYRTIAESVYVQTTHRSVGIVTATLDTACAGAGCVPLTSRWGLDPLWWATGDSSSARAARDNLLARATHATLSLAGVSQGQPLLQSIAPDSAAIVVAQPDTAHWTTFKAFHGGLSGFLHFSPIGFDSTRRSAIVFVDWKCGPACGHTVAVALRANDAGDWRIADMLLIRSLAGQSIGGAP